MKLKKLAVTICTCMAITFYTAWKAAAEEKPNLVNDGFSLGVMLVQNSMSGDFDNSSTYYTSTTLYDVPDVENGSGFGVAAGYRLDRAVYEIDYQRTTHDTKSSYTDVGDSASYNVVDFNIKYDVAELGRFRPYALLGVGIAWMTIEESATDGRDLNDETFLGYCWNLGAGVSYFINPKWAAIGGIIYRWNTFSSVEGSDLDDDLKENALGLSLGMTYTF